MQVNFDSCSQPFFLLHILHAYSCILEKELAAHSGVLAWRASWTEEPGGCSPWSHKESDTLGRLSSSIRVYSGPFGVEASFTWVVVKAWRGAHDLEYFDWAWESFILFVGFSRQEYWSGLPFPSPVDHICQTSPPWPTHLGWPHTAWLSFTELDKAVVCVIRLACCLWLWFQSVCPLMPSLSAYLLLGFLFPWTWGSSFQLLQQSGATAPYLRCGVASLGCRPWAWTWGSSSLPPPPASGLG